MLNNKGKENATWEGIYRNKNIAFLISFLQFKKTKYIYK